MAVRSRDEIIASIKAALGESATSDAGISLIEDVSDTMAEDWAGKTQALDREWQERYDALDKSWRDRYVERFEAGVDTSDIDVPAGNTDIDEDGGDNAPALKTSYDELFAVN